LLHRLSISFRAAETFALFPDATVGSCQPPFFRIAHSQLTTLRWELAEEICHLVEHGFEAISLWRPKISDIGLGEAARLLSRGGLAVSSLQWAGGFTGSDGRSYAESVADAEEAIETAAMLRCPTLILYAGCRGGHTLSHARRLLTQAVDELLPLAERRGVGLAIKPLRSAVHPGCGFMASSFEVISFVEQMGSDHLGVALDLWAAADDPNLPFLIERGASKIRQVSVADRAEGSAGESLVEQDRLPPGQGQLSLEAAVGTLIAAGYRGPIEFDPVGESVELAGYERTLATTSATARRWLERFTREQPRVAFQPTDHVSVEGLIHYPRGRFHFANPGADGKLPGIAGLMETVGEPQGVPEAHRLGTSGWAGILRSHASSQTSSRG
jgi:sugar phosphate isomerase/epimerase